ncbi:MAG: hypothetical protein R3B47_02575 [Bacteroidia bacterium]
MTYAKARVLSGIASVGWWIIVSIIGLWADISGAIAGFEGETRSWAILAVFVLGYIVLGFPFDLWGGYLLPGKYNRRTDNFSGWFAKWCRGVCIQGSLYWLFGMFIILAAKWMGLAGGLLAVTLMMLFLGRYQLWIGQLISPCRVLHVEQVGSGQVNTFQHIRYIIADSGESDFTGGIFGRPGKETIIMPSNWKAQAEPEVMEVMALRRLGAILSGSRSRGLMLAVIWNLLGFALASGLTPHPLSTAAGIIDVALIFTLFSFAGLFGMLPLFSRLGVREVDAWARSNGLCPFKLQQSFSFVSKQAADEPVRSRFLEFFCHPVPSVENRIKSLFLEENPYGAWQVARQSLFLSWSCLGLLSRFAHCNLGRPELWVMPPCE